MKEFKEYLDVAWEFHGHRCPANGPFRSYLNKGIGKTAFLVFLP